MAVERLAVCQRIRIELARGLKLIFVIGDLRPAVTVQHLLLDRVVTLVVEDVATLQGVQSVHRHRTLQDWVVFIG